MKEKAHYCRKCRKIDPNPATGKWIELSDRKYWLCQRHAEAHGKKIKVSLWRRLNATTLLCKEFRPDVNGNLPKEEINKYRRQGWTRTKPSIDAEIVRNVR